MVWTNQNVKMSIGLISYSSCLWLRSFKIAILSVFRQDRRSYSSIVLGNCAVYLSQNCLDKNGGGILWGSDLKALNCALNSFDVTSMLYFPISSLSSSVFRRRRTSAVTFRGECNPRNGILKSFQQFRNRNRRNDYRKIKKTCLYYKSTVNLFFLPFHQFRKWNWRNDVKKVESSCLRVMSIPKINGLHVFIYRSGTVPPFRNWRDWSIFQKRVLIDLPTRTQLFWSQVFI